MGPLPREHLVTGHDTYDFTKVDALLDAIASRGHQAVIRFTLDTPGRKTGMPQYLIDAGTDTSRYPTAATKTHGMGYYDDSLGYATLEGTSWHFIPKLKKQGEGDAWQHSPIGGELTRAKAASAAMGYTLQETRTSVTYNQVKATVVVEIKNTGVAPFYATWPLEVILVDENNEIVTSQTIESTPPSILPDQTGKVTARLPLPEKFRSNDSAQKLTAAIRVVNPLPNGAPVAFANEAMNKPLPGYLELGKLTRGRAPKN
nr:DUF4832 domain-containing protein [Schaalia odontolytica]